MTILVIGAGMAGLSCAHQLAASGAPVCVLDKGRGLGGRLATRRTECGRFDHGAQYVTARHPAFQTYLETAIQGAHARPWSADPDGETWYVGQPGMSGLIRPLAEGLDVRVSHEVSALRRVEGGWRVELARGERSDAVYPRVVLAIPPVQARRLLGAHAQAVPDLAKVDRAPCWTRMLALDGPVDALPSVRREADGPLALIARNETKSEYPASMTRLVIQAGPEWSHSVLEQDKEAVAAQMLEALQAVFPGLPEVRHAAAHRWRYARVVRPFGESCHWDATQGFGLAGDWCIGPRVEAAFLSGRALAEVILAER